MRRWILLGLGVTLVAIVGVAVFAISQLDDYLNQNRAWLEQQAEAAVGRPVAFEEIGVSVWPGLGVRLGALRVGDDPGFSTEDFVRVRDAEVRVRVLPALFGRYEISRIVLAEPSITIVRTDAGLSIESLASTSEATEAPSEEAGPAAFAIGLLEIEDGTLRFIDRSAKPPVELRIEQLDFEVSDLSPDDPLDFELSAAVLGAGDPNLEASGRVGPLFGPAGDPVPVAVELRLDPLAIDDLMRLPEFAELAQGGTSAAGVLRVRGKLAGTIADPELAVELDASDATLRAGEGFAKPAGVPLLVTVSGKREGETFQIASSRLSLAGAQLDARGSVTSGAALRYALELDSKSLPLAELAVLLPALEGTRVSGRAALDLDVKSAGAEAALPQLAGTLALTDVGVQSADAPSLSGLSTTLAFERGGLRLPATSFDLSGSQVQVEARVPDLARPVLGFELSSPRLLSTSLGLTGKGEALEQLGAKGSLRFPDSGPDLEMGFGSPRGTLSGLAYRELSGKLRYRNSIATLESLDLRAYDGTLDARGSYDTRDANNPAFKLETQIRDVKLEPLLRSQLPAAEPFATGRITTQLALDGTGSAWETIRSNLSGKGSFALADGALKDVNLADESLRSLTGVSGLSSLLSPELRKKYPGLFATGETRFEDLDAKLRISDGWADVRDLGLVAESFSLAGEGRVSLEGAVDMKTTFTASEALTRDLVAEVKPIGYLRDREGRVRVPLRWSGRYPRLVPQPDEAVVAQALQRALVGGLLGSALGDPKKGEPAEPTEGKAAEGGTAKGGLRDLLRGLPIDGGK